MVGDDEFHTVLADAMHSRQISLAQLSRRLGELGTPISPGALGYWRSGARMPEQHKSLDALTNLEVILKLSPGELTSRLGRGRRMPRDHRVPYGELTADAGATDALISSTHGHDDDALAMRTVFTTITVDADYRGYTTESVARWQAIRDGAQTTLFKTNQDSLGETPRPLRAEGCELSLVATDGTSGVSIWRATLPRSLRKGEFAITRRVLRCRDSVAMDNFESIVQRRVEAGLLWVQFAGLAPAIVEQFLDSDEDRQQHRVRTVGNAVSVHVSGFGPGVFGVRWKVPVGVE